MLGLAKRTKARFLITSTSGESSALRHLVFRDLGLILLVSLGRGLW